MASETSPATTIAVTDLPSLAGKDLGTSRWVELTQEQVDAFATLTGDRQWIHVDPDRAARGPFGTTVAHGFFTLSLSSGLLFELVNVEGAAQILNYGLNRVRFPAPNRVPGRIRMAATISSVEEVTGGYQVVYALTFTRDDLEKPVAAAELLFRYYLPAAGS